jgi:hypothetical protein
MSRDDRLQTPMPECIAKLDKDERGYPVTYIAAFIDGKPDLGIQDAAKVASCLREWRCHVCGEKLGKLGYFVAYEPVPKRPRFLDPAIHRECAMYSLQVCPYLANPSAKHRSAKALPNDMTDLGEVTGRSYNVVLLGTPGQKTVKIQGKTQTHLSIMPTDIVTREKIDIREL